MVEMVEGARYRRRDGYEPPEPSERTGDDDYPWRIGWLTYTSTGNWSHVGSGHPEDLVAMTYDPRVKVADAMLKARAQ